MIRQCTLEEARHVRDLLQMINDAKRHLSDDELVACLKYAMIEVDRAFGFPVTYEDIFE